MRAPSPSTSPVTPPPPPSAIRHPHQRNRRPRTGPTSCRHHGGAHRSARRTGRHYRRRRNLLPYDGEPGTSLALPAGSTQASAINAEFFCRGSFLEPTDRITLPTTRQEPAKAAAVEHPMETIESQPADATLRQGRHLWAHVPDSRTFPSDEDCPALLASLQFQGIRDRLNADFPGLDEPTELILFAQTDQAPKWSRIGRAQQLLHHAYSHQRRPDSRLSGCFMQAPGFSA